MSTYTAYNAPGQPEARIPTATEVSHSFPPRHPFAARELHNQLVTAQGSWATDFSPHGTIGFGDPSAVALNPSTYQCPRILGSAAKDQDLTGSNPIPPHIQGSLPASFLAASPSTQYGLQGQPDIGCYGPQNLDDPLQWQYVTQSSQYSQQTNYEQSLPTQNGDQGSYPPQHFEMIPAPPSNQLQCRWAHCPLGPGGPKEMIFRRKFELERHMLRHTEPDRFKCSAINCRKYFPRADKLKAHVKAGHDNDTFFACPVDDCLLAALAMTRPEMCDHLSDSHMEVRLQYKHHFAALGCQ